MCNCKAGCGNRRCGCVSEGKPCSDECGCFALKNCQNQQVASSPEISCSCGGKCATRRCDCVSAEGKCGSQCGCDGAICVNREPTKQVQQAQQAQQAQQQPQKKEQQQQQQQQQQPQVPAKPAPAAQRPPGSPEQELARRKIVHDTTPPPRPVKPLAPPPSQPEAQSSSSDRVNCCSCVKSLCGTKHCPCMRAGIKCTGCALGEDLCKNCDGSGAAGAQGAAATMTSSAAAGQANSGPVRGVRVVIKSASGLKVGDVLTGKSDPYVKIFASDGTLLETSRVVKKTLAPVWDHTCKFSELPGDGSLTLEVFDKNFLLKDDHLGRARLDVRSRKLTAAPRDIEVSLDTQGSVLVSLAAAEERQQALPEANVAAPDLFQALRNVRLKVGRTLFPVSGALLGSSQQAQGTGHCGWLQKKGEDVAGMWRTRWFRLRTEQQALVYYKDSNEVKEQGRIPLVPGQFHITTRGQNYIYIDVLKNDRELLRRYKLWSEQSDDCSEWTEELTKLSGRAARVEPVQKPTAQQQPAPAQRPAAAQQQPPRVQAPHVTPTKTNAATGKAEVTGTTPNGRWDPPKPAKYTQVAPSPNPARTKGKQPSAYAQQQARRDIWLATLEASPRMNKRLDTGKFKVLSVCQASGRSAQKGSWLYRYQLLRKDGITTIDTAPTPGPGEQTGTWDFSAADQKRWFGLPHVVSALKMARKSTEGRREGPMTRWTKNIIYYAVCLVKGEDFGYVGKAKNGIMDRWLIQSSSHCKHAQKMMDGDAASLDRRQFVDVMLAYLGCENFLLIPVAQSDSADTLRELERGLILDCKVQGPAGMNIAK